MHVKPVCLPAQPTRGRPSRHVLIHRCCVLLLRAALCQYLLGVSGDERRDLGVPNHGIVHGTQGRVGVDDRLRDAIQDVGLKVVDAVGN